MEGDGSSLIRRAPTVFGKTRGNGLDLRGIADNGDYGHRASTLRTAEGIDIINHGQEARPCFSAVAHAYPLILGGFPRGRRLCGLSAVSVLGAARGDGGAVFPGPSATGGIQANTAQLVSR